MATRLTKRDIARIEECHPALQKLWYALAKDTMCPPFRIIDGARTIAEQRENVRKGVSKTMNSYHIRKASGYSHATDVAPLVNGKISWDWKYYYPLADDVKAMAEKLGIDVQWGGDWKWKDGPHWQLNKKTYPWADRVEDDIAYDNSDLDAGPIPEPVPDGNFQVSIPLVLKHEGGYVNHPMDDGGPTYKGITLTTYRRYINPRGKATDLKKMPQAQIIDIYKQHYWDKVRADMLPPGVDHAVFDFAVNSGPVKATRFLQDVVGAEVDGKLGPATLRAVRAMMPARLITALCDQRMRYLEEHEDAPTFLKGWRRRVNRVRKEALGMVVVAPMPETIPDSVDPVERERIEPAPIPPRKKPRRSKIGAVAVLFAIFIIVLIIGAILQ